MRLEIKTFSSKISQRIFTTFVICALVPVGCVAVLAYFKVMRHLQVQALDGLRHAAKSQTKTLVDRLELVESELRLVDSVIKNQKRIEPHDLDDLLRDRLQERFSSISLIRSPNEPQPLLNQQVIPPLLLASDDMKHLSAGYPLLVELDVPSSKPSIIMLRLVDSKKAARGFWVGEINHNYLWAIDKMDNLPLDTEFCVLDSSHRLLYSSRPNMAKIAGLLKSNTQASTSGHFEFSANGEQFIASYTQMFVKQYFKLPHWTVILFKPKSDVFAPLAEFKMSFPAIIILTLMVVLWLSIVNIRKNLVPIGALKEGAQRIAVRDFSQPVSVSRHDEFKDLADAFNEMAEALNHKFKTLSAKAEIDRAVVSTLDPDKIIKAAITRIADCVACRVYGISLIDVSASARNRVLYSFQFERQSILTQTVTITPHERRVLAQHPNYLIVQANDPRPHYLPTNSHLRLPTLIILPVWVKKKLAAILWLAGSLSAQFTTEDITLARQLADQVAVALSNSSLIAELQEMNWGALQALARAVDAKSAWTAGHSSLEKLQRGAFLHDIGKIGVPAAVLDKPAKLSDEEFGLIKCHPDLGAKIIEPINAFKEILPMVSQHHERFDGKGYPAGLAGYEIHQSARILAVADVYDALSSDRPYRKGMVIEVALGIIQEEAGHQFDQEMVEALLKVIAEDQQRAA
jgi:HAMP domain-containing protein